MRYGNDENGYRVGHSYLSILFDFGKLMVMGVLRKTVFVFKHESNERLTGA